MDFSNINQSFLSGGGEVLKTKLYIFRNLNQVQIMAYVLPKQSNSMANLF